MKGHESLTGLQTYHFLEPWKSKNLQDTLLKGLEGLKSLWAYLLEWLEKVKDKNLPFWRPGLKGLQNYLFKGLEGLKGLRETLKLAGTCKTI